MQHLDILIAIVLMAPACWRISNLIVNEDGPWFVFDNIRRMVEAKEYNDNPPPDRRWYIGIFECVWCCSVWVGIGYSILYFFYPGVAVYLSLPFTLSAVAIIINQVLQRLD